MQTFVYNAKDRLGHLHDGSIEAATEEEARDLLAVDGMQLLSIEEDEPLGFSFLGNRISRKDIIYLASQLSIMVETGINLSTALAGIAEQEKNPNFKALLIDLKHEVDAGEDFSTALARYPQHFDTTFVSLIRASEKTGLMGEMLDRISIYLRKQSDTAAKVRGALAYPAVMAVLAVGVTIFLLTFVLPRFEPLFARKGVKLPATTVIMMTASDILMNYWHLWLPGLIAAAVSFYFFRRTPTGKQFIDYVKINFPLIGGMVRKVTISRSLSTLGTLVRSDVPMLQALELTSEVCNNTYYAKLWDKVISKVTAGNQIHEALRSSDLIPSTIVQMIAAGEETGRLDDVLDKVSAHCESEVDLSIKTTTSLIEPLLISAMGLIVGGIALGLLMPIFSLSRSV